MKYLWFLYSVGALCLTMCLPANAYEWQGKLNLQNRLYANRGAEVTDQFYPSLYAQIDVEEDIFEDSAFSASVSTRFDTVDKHRNEVDIREAYFQHYIDEWEIGAGIGKTTWGVNEIFKTLDVINQKDRKELPFTSKLGQTMLNVKGSYQDYSVEGYLLYGIEEAWFPGEKGRFRYPLPIEDDNSIVDGGMSGNYDFALRVGTDIGVAELFATHFYGISRDPYFVFNADFENPALQPVYDKVNRSGLSVLYPRDDTLYKLEIAHQTGGAENYQSVAGGLEYAYGTFFTSDTDVTFYVEAIWDSRDHVPASLFDHDIGLATRLQFNDVNDSFLMLGSIIDYEYSEMMAYGYFQRNIGDNWSLSVFAQYFYANEPRPDIEAFQESISSLVDEIEDGTYPLTEESIALAIAQFSGATINKKQYDVILEQFEKIRADENYLSGIPTDTIPQTLYDLLRVSDNSQKMNLIQRDSFIQLDINYYF